MAEDLMRYDLLTQDALRGVVRKALKRVMDHGLPGDHHFYIAFRTDAPDVRISPRLQRLYPEEITIVLQHQFCDLIVDENQFQVRLSFDNIGETLTVPFTAIKGFFDPSIQFGLQFESPKEKCGDSDSAKQESAVQSGVPEETKPGKEKKQKQSQSKSAGDLKEDGTNRTAAVVQLDIFRKKN